MKKLIRTERGWVGHFICADSCKFKRNTLIEYGDKKWIISTVGCMICNGKIKTIGRERYYETMAFEAKFDNPYLDIDVSKPIEFDSNWAIGEINSNSDLIANDMHETVVEELSKKILEGNK